MQTFENLGDREVDYFANGLTEELLIKLDRYKSTWGPINVFHAADLSELDISARHDYVLEGTVSRVEDSIRVTARRKARRGPQARRNRAGIILPRASAAGCA